MILIDIIHENDYTVCYLVGYIACLENVIF